MTKQRPIILAAGGTGGHLYPAEALAEELLRRHHRVIITTDKRGAAFRRLDGRAEIVCLRAGTLKGGILGKITGLCNLGLGIFQSLRLLLRTKPALVIGFGGYPSFPPVFSAQMLGMPTVIHEQNAILGKANRWLEKSATAIAASLPGTQGIPQQSTSKITVTGNPVRNAVAVVRDLPYPALDRGIHILITGGSQGAKIFSDVVPKAAALLPEDIKQRLVIAHQCRESDIEAAGKAYAAANIKAETRVFFDDMPQRLGACHLFIGRSGASTVAEIAAVGRPAIFIPLWHADRQQYLNAGLIAEKGGAWVIEQKDFTPESLAQKIAQLANNPAMLENAAQAAKACGKTDAAQALADLVERIMKAGRP